MRVFLHGSPSRPPEAMHIMFVTPAAHLAGQECPHEWVDAEGKPKTFQIEFQHGMAEVEDSVGKYLIDIGQAHKSRLVLPGYGMFGA